MEKASTSSVQTSLVSREIAHLAFVKVKQDDWLTVRQEEQLRRALMSLGELLAWAVTSANSDDPIADVSKSTKKMMTNGARAIKRSLANDMAIKKAEITELKKVARSSRKLSENLKTVYPFEITYHRSARDSVQSMFTKTEDVEVNNAEETLALAEAIERQIDHWTTLRDIMIAELKLEQKQLGVMTKNLSEFVKSMHTLLGEVVATLS
jgi:methylthioribose-1-phosphate isomerase